jgi:hypothetical protein
VLDGWWRWKERTICKHSQRCYAARVIAMSPIMTVVRGQIVGMRFPDDAPHDRVGRQRKPAFVMAQGARQTAWMRRRYGRR